MIRARKRKSVGNDQQAPVEAKSAADAVNERILSFSEKQTTIVKSNDCLEGFDDEFKDKFVYLKKIEVLIEHYEGEPHNQKPFVRARQIICELRPNPDDLDYQKKVVNFYFDRITKKCNKLENIIKGE